MAQLRSFAPEKLLFVGSPMAVDFVAGDHGYCLAFCCYAMRGSQIVQLWVDVRRCQRQLNKEIGTDKFVVARGGETAHMSVEDGVNAKPGDYRGRRCMRNDG